ncbi:unnamed protein product [Paramecium octaurelia]|uniref:Thioredoxin domain-containing protein n=1 Tax=Paramecium octaurelia TaxID=43137 RepID=A0A8S1YJ19_PAROT|nr:unnamed protein product [Paramecium octaurelia]
MTNITNLEKWVQKQNYTLIFFTRDDCNHCQRLEEELEKASEMINVGTPGSIGFPVARIKNYDLNRYPVLRLYVKGLYTEHSGEWEQKKLEAWTDIRALSYISDSDSEPTIRWIHESHNISVLVFNDQFKQELKWLKTLKHHVHFTYTTLPNARSLLNVGEETTLVMFTEKGLNRYDYDGEITYEKVFKFVEDHEEKYYQEFTQEAIETAFYEPKKPVLFIFDEKDYRDLAKTHQKEINTILVKQDQVTDRLLNYLGVKGIQRPLAVIYDQNHSQKKYRTQFSELSELRKFVNNFLNKKLEPYYKSQTPVKNENWEKQILTIVGEDLPKHDNIFIYFYSSWCKVCQQFTPIFEQLFQKYRGQKAFGMFDASENEVKDQFIKEVPMIRWYNSQTRQVVTFEGPLTLEAISEFIDKQGKKQVSDDL